MDHRFLNSLPERLRFAAANLAPLPLFAVLLVAAAGYLQLALLPAREAAIESTEHRLAVVERNARRAALEQHSTRTTPEEARQRLLAAFPETAALSAELGRLVELAEKQGLMLSGGDYRLQPAKDGALFDRYQLTLPVKGDYRAVRTYLKRVRADFPGLAIEDIALRRDSIASAEIEAQLRFVVFARKANP